MHKTVEFWLRIAIVAFMVFIIIEAPAVLFPFIISMFIAILLTPLARKIEKWAKHIGLKRFPYDLAIVISFAIFIAVIYLIAVHIFVPFVEEFQEFIKSVPAVFEALQKRIPELEQQLSLNIMPPEIRNVVTNVIQEIGEYTLKIAQFSLSAIFSFATTVVELIVVPFITFYMMKKGGDFAHAFIRLFPERYHSHLEQLVSEIHFVLKAYIHGQLLLSVLMATIVFLGMWIMDIPYPLVIGLLAGIVEMVPTIGPIVGAIPPVLLGILQGTGTLVQVLIFYVVVQQLDSHFIMPKLMGSIIKVHPVAIIGGVLIGGSLYGPVGMMISVPVVAVLQILFKHMWYYDRYKNTESESVSETEEDHEEIAGHEDAEG